MRPGRLAAAVTASAIAAAALALVWRHHHSPTPPAPGAPEQTPNAAGAPPPAHRLAGVALGSQGAYAVFADASGQTDLYHLGDAVPGLGTLSRVEEGRAVVRSDRGEIEFRVRPAPTTTAEPAPRSSPTAPPLTATPSPRPAHTAPGSPLSAAPDQSAS